VLRFSPKQEAVCTSSSGQRSATTRFRGYAIPHLI
jgi:hypothetical protein